MKTPPNCLACTLCEYTAYEPGYSEYTPSTPMHFRCVMGRWAWDDHRKPTGPKATFEAAIGCPHFEPEEWAK